jgi:hypothetical protein
LALQRTAGNRAVAAVVQRSPVATAQHPALARGSTGKGVKKLQQRLNVLGASPPLKVDGIFGPKTQQALVAFQSAHLPDPHDWIGKAGPKTWDAIDGAYAPPEIAADEKETGKHVKEKMDQINTQESGEDKGVWYTYNYKATFPHKFKPDHENGFADPALFEREAPLTWRVKSGVSASAAVQSWLRGLTIAECYTALIASEFDTLRAAVGNEKFDDKFGSTDKVVPTPERMLIAMPSEDPTSRSQIDSFLKPTEAAGKGDVGAPGNRPAEVGEWCYFMNHPKYLLKHPGGAWQGENSVYMGREGTADAQMWAGMGTFGGTGPGGPSHVTEEQMLAEMVGAYNTPRDGEDAAAIARITASNGGTLPSQLAAGSGAFPDTLAGPADILNAPAEKVDLPGLIHDTEERTGGFRAGSGKTLDLAAVRALRDS